MSVLLLTGSQRARDDGANVRLLRKIQAEENNAVP